MLLSEAKEILEKNGYRLNENTELSLEEYKKIYYSLTKIVNKLKKNGLTYNNIVKDDIPYIEVNVNNNSYRVYELGRDWYQINLPSGEAYPINSNFQQLVTRLKSFGAANFKEAKEILEKNGYSLKALNENDRSFKQWYTTVADEIEKFGYDEVILSDAMEDEQMTKTIIDMYDEGMEPLQAASEVIDWSDSKKM